MHRPGGSGTPLKDHIMNTALKIENIIRATLNGRSVKLFTAYRAIEGGWIHIGQFSAPARTANKNLDQFISE